MTTGHVINITPILTSKLRPGEVLAAGYYPARCPTLIPLEITTTAIDRSHYHNGHKQFFWKPIKTGLIGPVLSEKVSRIAHWTDQSLPCSFRKPGSTRETHELDLVHRALQLCRPGRCDSL